LLAFTNYITKSLTIAEVHRSFFPLRNGISSWLCKAENTLWQAGYSPPFCFMPSISRPKLFWYHSHPFKYTRLFVR
jgi:hypothetical protein